MVLPVCVVASVTAYGIAQNRAPQRPNTARTATGNNNSTRSKAPQTRGAQPSGVPAPHIFHGNWNEIPASVTQRIDRSHRAPGDQTVSRQTTLVTSQVLPPNSAGNSSSSPLPQTTIVAASQDLQPFWTADEKFIFFSSNRASTTDTSANTNGIFNIYSSSPDGSGITAWTPGTDNAIEPNVSNDGGRLAYASGGSITLLADLSITTTGFKLLTKNLADSTIVNLTDRNPQGFAFTDIRHPSWIPGGNRIVFSGKIGIQPYHLFIVNVDTNVITRLTDGASNDTAPAWSPDGNLIAFTTNAQAFIGAATNPVPLSATTTKATTDIWVINTNALHPNPSQVTNSAFALGGQTGIASNNRNPAWSTLRNDPLRIVPRVGGNAQELLAFASDRVPSSTTGAFTTRAATTDIYWLKAGIVADPAVGGTFKIQQTEATGNPGLLLRTTTPGFQNDPDATTRPEPASSFDPGHTWNEDYPAWPQYISSYRIAFQSNRNNNLNVWAATVFDINAPSLLKYDIGTNQVVGLFRDSSNPPQPGTNGADRSFQQREFSAGEKVRFRVRAVDYETGINTVYVQMKNPNSAQQDSKGVEHKQFYAGSAVGLGLMDQNTLVVNPPIEFDCQGINPTTYAYPAAGIGPNANVSIGLGSLGPIANPATWPGFNAQYAGFDDITAYSGGVYNATTGAFTGGNIADTSTWLRLYDDGPISAGGHEPNGEVAGDGIYTNTWVTPQDNPSDWYLDVIVTDKAVNPFDTTQATNWKVYDNVWGFTTQPFTVPTNATILYVNDYDIGQKFFQTRFGSGTTFAAFYAGVATESWMTEYDTSAATALIPTTWINPTSGMGGPLINFLDTMGALSYGAATDLIPPPIDGRTRDGSPIPITQHYVQWRILSRGPVPDSVLQNFRPRVVTQPADVLVANSKSKQVTVAEKCVIWHSPYTGDLFVGPGTLLETSVQNQLTAFVANGGRLFLSGQDVAWALSLGNAATGATGNGVTFLDTVFHVKYVADVGGTRPLATTAGGPIVSQTWAAPFQHAYPPINPNYDPPSTGLNLFNPPPFDYKTYACPNIDNPGSLDIVTFTPPVAANGGTDATNNGPAIVWYSDATQQSKVVFSPIPWEAIMPEFYTPTIPPNPANSLALKNRRTELVHNVGDYLRTGRIVGQVRDINGGSVFGGVFIRATHNGVTAATTISLGDGSYVLEGLDALGLYSIDAFKAGFVTLHVDGNVFHGGYQARVDLFLTPVQPGTIRGRVVVDSTGDPVPGAIVTAYDPLDNSKTYTATTDVDGQFRLTGIPSITDPTNPSTPLGYIVRVTNLQNGPSNPKLGYGSSAPTTYGLLNPNNATEVAAFPNPSPRVAVSAGQDVDLGQAAFRLKQIPGSIVGIVTRRNVAGTDTGNGIAGASVTAVQGAFTVTVTTSIGGSGNPPVGSYTLPNLPPGSYKVTASAAGFQDSPQQTVVVITNQQTPNINFALFRAQPGLLSGSVTLRDTTQFVSGATITLLDAAGNPLKDADGNTVAAATSGASQTANSYTFNYKFSAVPAGSVQVQVAKAGYNNVSGTKTVTVAIGAETQNVNFVLDPKATFTAGLTMVSAPQEYTTPIFDLLALSTSDRATAALITWDPAARAYVRNTAPADTLHRGRGYFLYVPNGAVLASDGTGDDTQPFSVALQTGWNMIGSPYTFPVDLSKLTILDGGVSVTVPNAQSGTTPALGSALYTYSGGSYTLSYTIDAYRGYWIKAYRPITLVFDPSAKTTRAAAPKVATNITGDGWVLNLLAQAGDKYAAPGYLGVNRSATDGFDRYKLETPPSIGTEGVTLTFEHSDWGDKSGNYTMDVRSAAQTQQSWNFTVNSSVTNAPVVLRWPAVAEVPGKQSMTLTDLDSKVSINLRNRSSYVIAASDKAITRHFRLDVHRAGRQKLQLTDIVAHSGGSRAAGMVISYRLSAEADVQVNILQNGRHIRALEPGRHRAPGPADVSWDLRNDKGVAVAGDTYTVEVRATDADGNVVRQVTPLLVTR